MHHYYFLCSLVPRPIPNIEKLGMDLRRRGYHLCVLEEIVMPGFI